MTIRTGTGASERLVGTRGNDELDGLGGNDRLYGLSGHDVIDGGLGCDLIDGGEGNDTIDGGGDDDEINAGDGDDLLDGGANDDFLSGGAGNDTFTGGSGADTFFFDPYADGGADTVTDFAPGEDLIDLSHFSDIDGFDDLVFTSDDDGVTLDPTSQGGGTVRLEGVSLDALFDIERELNGEPAERRACAEMVDCLAIQITPPTPRLPRRYSRDIATPSPCVGTHAPLLPGSARRAARRQGLPRPFDKA